MSISGFSLIACDPQPGTGAVSFAIDPASGERIEPGFPGVSPAQVDTACRMAGAAFDAFRATSDLERARFLDAIGDEILALGETLVERVMRETGLPRARVEGERGRTVGQLQLFASLLREGSWCDARIDQALPERQPPRPDLRYRLIGVGPVAVFAASNFPLAFSVAGGDTAAALAAGCPVVVKAHSAHPGTSELVGGAIVRALRACGLPAGVFSLLFGSGATVGQALVGHPAIQAVGFTGSRHAGQTLMTVAAARPQPIPVYAEMSSVNPIFLLPAALAARTSAIATGFAASLTQGVGQFCTNPGLVVGIAGPAFEHFAQEALAALGAVPPGTMLNRAIADSYRDATAQLAAQPEVQVLHQAPAPSGQGGAALFRTTAARWLADAALHGEMFGPASLLVACRDEEELYAVAERLEGQLTVTLQLDEADLALAAGLLPVLERKAGRVLANGFPTGVEVAAAMVHGGPFPATSDGRSTSVGTAAIARFLRPVCYQNLPDALLPAALKAANPQGIWRLTGGELGKR